MEKTAVEWLRRKLFSDFGIGFSDNILEEAKKIEIQNIKKAYIAGQMRNELPKTYIKEIYGKESND